MEYEYCCVASTLARAKELAREDEYPVGVGGSLHGARFYEVRFADEIVLDATVRAWLKNVVFCRIVPKKDENG